MTSSSGPLSDSQQPMETQPATVDESQVIDVDAALKRLGGDRNILIELAKMFGEDAPGLIASIEMGIDEARFNDVGRTAHNLRGLAANFGAARLIARLKQLEGAAAQANRDESLALVDTVRAEKRRLDEALAVYCR